MTHCIIESQARSPVVDYQGDVVQFERVYESLHVFGVIDEPIADIRFVGFSHADQVEGDRSTVRLKVGNDVVAHQGQCICRIKI